ncbi:MAG: hypothetical protein ACRDKS_05635, partial [Actinomycetota bacterium]
MKIGTRARALALLAALGFVIAVVPLAEASNCAGTSVGFKPLIDLKTGTFKGEQGGLYPGGTNTRPASHTTKGKTLAEENAVPRRADGTVDLTGGTLVFLSIGMSNTQQETDAFIPMADADPAKSDRVVVVNGAESQVDSTVAADPNAAYWGIVDSRLSAAGVTGKQVGVVWLKQVRKKAKEPFPKDAQILEDNLTSIVKILKDRFPNLWLVYLSSRIYAGYATTNVSPEPQAYDSGFAVKWLIERQLQGSLPVGSSVPWLSWGPYLWADGTHPRSDGLTWVCSDFEEQDGMHPGPGAEHKVASMLLDFVHADVTAKIWYGSIGQTGTGGSGGSGGGSGGSGSSGSASGSGSGSSGGSTPGASATPNVGGSTPSSPSPGSTAGATAQPGAIAAGGDLGGGGSVAGPLIAGAAGLAAGVG